MAVATVCLPRRYGKVQEATAVSSRIHRLRYCLKWPYRLKTQLGCGRIHNARHTVGVTVLAALPLAYSRAAVQEIGARTIRPYAMNAMRSPRPALMTMDVISRYLTCTPMNTRLSAAKTVAATTVSIGFP